MKKQKGVLLRNTVYENIGLRTFFPVYIYYVLFVCAQLRFDKLQ